MKSLSNQVLCGTSMKRKTTESFKILLTVMSKIDTRFMQRNVFLRFHMLYANLHFPFECKGPVVGTGIL